MSNYSPYAFIDKVFKQDTNLLNYYLYNGKYENCPKNNPLMHIDVDQKLEKIPQYKDQHLVEYKNIYLIKNC